MQHRQKSARGHTTDQCPPSASPCGTDKDPKTSINGRRRFVVACGKLVSQAQPEERDGCSKRSLGGPPPLDRNCSVVDRRAAVFDELPIYPTRSSGLVWQGPSPRVVPVPGRFARRLSSFVEASSETNAGVDLCQAAVASRDSIAFNGSRSAMQPVERSPIAWPYL